jgi:catechol 2,3-dioxygenase-like lactoylglutathione lyase family enzyme
MALRYNFTRLLVRDFATSFRFYRDTLGFTPVWGDETGTYADFQTGEVTIALFVRNEMAEAVGTSALAPTAETQDRVALCFAVDDVGQAYEELRAKGVTFVTEPHDQTDWGIRAAHFRDPDGTLLELFSALPK